MSTPVAVGQHAPDFRLSSADGVEVALSSFAGKTSVVLFFYPRDESPGCTTEACSFRDAYEEFVAAGAEVIGISSDSLDSHSSFAHKHGLQFQLLADKGGVVRERYGIKASLGVIPGRETFVIDKHGVVRHVFRSQLRVKQHVAEALQILARL
jgi:peroxiredoxin Q/BCP